MTITIEQVVAQIDAWQGKSAQISVMTGGITNTNFKVEVDGQAHFVRIPGASTDLLAIDRENERFNSQAAAEAGVGPKVLHTIPEHDVMVIEFIQGRTMSVETLNAPGMPTRIAESLRQLHAGPRFLKDFNMFRTVEFYMEMVDKHAVRIPEDYRRHLPLLADIEAAVDAKSLPSVPCNNDLLSENYIDDGQKLWLIDYEYSGNNDPCFELGNTCQEQQYGQSQFEEMCAAYFGETKHHLLARMRLFALMSDMGWTLWGAIQNKISQLDFDFWEYTMERWGRAREMMASEAFKTWLADARRDD